MLRNVFPCSILLIYTLHNPYFFRKIFQLVKGLAIIVCHPTMTLLFFMVQITFFFYWEIALLCPMIFWTPIFLFCAVVTRLLNFRNHSKDITNVTFHRKYPLFASSSEDCTAYVFHGMVYSDLNQNPLIVPLEILRGHSSSDGRGTYISSVFFNLHPLTCPFSCTHFFTYMHY